MKLTRKITTNYLIVSLKIKKMIGNEKNQNFFFLTLLPPSNSSLISSLSTSQLVYHDHQKIPYLLIEIILVKFLFFIEETRFFCGHKNKKKSKKIKIQKIKFRRLKVPQSLIDSHLHYNKQLIKHMKG